LSDYWRNELQVAYESFINQNDDPLRKFFIEHAARQDFIFMMMNFFDSKQDLIWVLEQLESTASEQEKQQFVKMKNLVKRAELDAKEYALLKTLAPE